MKEKLYEGKAKILYPTEKPDEYIVYFKDDATAFNNLKKAVLENKGILNNRISTVIFKLLEKNKIPIQVKPAGIPASAEISRYVL